MEIKIGKKSDSHFLKTNRWKDQIRFRTIKVCKRYLLIMLMLAFSSTGGKDLKACTVTELINTFSILSSAHFETSCTDCIVAEAVQFINNSDDAIAYYWDFGDGQSSTEKHPSHTYTSAGCYEVTLVVTVEGGQAFSYIGTVDILDT